MNGANEMTKIDKIQQDALTKNKIVDLLMRRSTLELWNHAKKIMACLLFH